VRECGLIRPAKQYTSLVDSLTSTWDVSILWSDLRPDLASPARSNGSNHPLASSLG
jgi:hypothetical protein